MKRQYPTSFFPKVHHKSPWLAWDRSQKLGWKGTSLRFTWSWMPTFSHKSCILKAVLGFYHFPLVFSWYWCYRSARAHFIYQAKLWIQCFWLFSCWCCVWVWACFLFFILIKYMLPLLKYSFLKYMWFFSFWILETLLNLYMFSWRMNEARCLWRKYWGRTFSSNFLVFFITI